MDQSKILEIITIGASSFFAAFTIAINSKANKRRFTPMQFFAEVLTYGVAGFIIGLLATLMIEDILILCAVSGIGGLFGQPLLKIIVNGFLSKYLPKSDNENDTRKFL